MKEKDSVLGADGKDGRAVVDSTLAPEPGPVSFRPAGIAVTIPVETVDREGNVIGVVRFDPVVVYHPYGEGLAYCIAMACARAEQEWRERRG